MFAVFALLHLRWRSIVIILCVAAAFAAWPGRLRRHCSRTADKFARDYQLYKEQNIPTSIGLRLEFWREVAAVLCRGAGRSATARVPREACSSASPRTVLQCWQQAQVIGNPHNQTLNVAVQWGTIGVVMLYAMWLSHLLAVSRRRAGHLDRAAGRRAEHLHLAVQLASVRFSRGLDVCAGRRRRRRHGAARQIRGGRGIFRNSPAMIAGMRAADKISAGAGRPANPHRFRSRPLE